MKKIVLFSLSSCILLLLMPMVSSVETKMVNDEIEEIFKENLPRFDIQNNFGYISEKINTLSKSTLLDLNEIILKTILMILLIIDIPVVVFSVIISVICYMIYLPVQFMAYVYQKYFWNSDIPIAITPMFLVYQLFGFLLQIIGYPIIFIIGTLQYLKNTEDKEYDVYLKSVTREYVKFISDLLVLFFPPDLPNC